MQNTMRRRGRRRAGAGGPAAAWSFVYILYIFVVLCGQRTIPV